MFQSQNAANSKPSLFQKFFQFYGENGIENPLPNIVW